MDNKMEVKSIDIVKRDKEATLYIDMNEEYSSIDLHLKDEVKNRSFFIDSNCVNSNRKNKKFGCFRIGDINIYIHDEEIVDKFIDKLMDIRQHLKIDDE